MRIELVVSDFAYIYTNSIILEQDRLQTVPLRIGHNYRPVRVHDIDELYSTYLNHRRLKVFANKDLKCEYCEKRGFFLIECVDLHGAIHLDVYTEDFELMTIDHIIPKSKGGHKTDLSNLVPCCNTCNTKKGAIIW